MRTALGWHRVIIPAAEIDACGLHVCNIAGMRRALAGLARPAGVRAHRRLRRARPGRPCLAMWKGDEVAACVAAASVVAKVTRDRIMPGLTSGTRRTGSPGTRDTPRRSTCGRWPSTAPCPEHRARSRLSMWPVRDLPVVDEEPRCTAGPW